MNGVRQTTAVAMTFRKHNKISLERWEGPYRSSGVKISCTEDIFYIPSNSSLTVTYFVPCVL